MVDEMEETTEEENAEEVEKKVGEPEPLTSQGFTARGEVDYATFSFFVDSITALTDEATWQFDKDGIKVRQMDASQIAMVVTELKPIKYQISEPMAVGVQMKNLQKITSRLKDMVSFSIDEDRKLTIKSKSSVWKMPLMESGPEPKMKEPKVEGLLQLPNKTASDFRALLKDAALVSSHVSFHDEDGKLVISAIGDVGRGDFYLEDKVGKLSSTYPLDFLTKLIPKGCDFVSISIATNKPIRIEAKMATGESAVYWLAPRIETD